MTDSRANRSAGLVEGAGANRASWDAAVLSGGGHLLQSWAWGAFKAQYGWNVERLAIEAPGGGAIAQTLYRHKGPFSLGYIPRGPVILGGRDGVMRLFEAVDRASRRHRALSLVVELDRRLPLTGTFKSSGFVRGPHHLQPARTVKVPLGDDDQLLRQMHAKTRYNVRMAQRRGVEIEVAERGDGPVDRFYTLLRETSARNQFLIHDRDYYGDFLRIFGNDAVLMFAHADGALAAGMIAAKFGDEAIYMYSASSTEHRAHGAAFLLQFEAMRWARESGCRRYDLWGIPAVDPPTKVADDGDRLGTTRGDDWRGLYQFKVRFGGEIVTYPPTLERRYHRTMATLAHRFYPANG